MGDYATLEQRVTWLEAEQRRQFTPGESIHAQDHDTLREAGKDRHRALVSLSEKIGWAVVVACGILVGEGLKVWLTR